MGHIEVDVGIGRSEGKKLIKSKALVDLGATFTVIPEDIARELNLTLVGEKVKVSTAEGYDELDLTHSLLEINGKIRIMPVLVSKHIDRVLSGGDNARSDAVTRQPTYWKTRGVHRITLLRRKP